MRQRVECRKADPDVQPTQSSTSKRVPSVLDNYYSTAKVHSRSPCNNSTFYGRRRGDGPYKPKHIFKQVSFQDTNWCPSPCAKSLQTKKFDIHCKQANLDVLRLASQNIVSKIGGDTKLHDSFFSPSFRYGPLSGQTKDDRIVTAFLRDPSSLGLSGIFETHHFSKELERLCDEGFVSEVAERALYACAGNLSAARILLSS